MLIRVLEMVPAPSTEGNVFSITYIPDKRGNHLLVYTAGSCRRTLIKFPSTIVANST